MLYTWQLRYTTWLGATGSTTFVTVVAPTAKDALTIARVKFGKSTEPLYSGPFDMECTGVLSAPEKVP